MELHRAAVARIAASVRSFYERAEPFRIAHGSTNTTRPLRDSRRTVDISALDRVLRVDRASRTALVEPNVPMDALVASTLRHGLVPPVVMEFPGITAGGGFAGTGGESSSFRHGFFDDCVRSVEMVLADGAVVRASRHENADLFAAARGAVGSLGITTLLELELLEARRFVRTTYRRTASVADAVAAVKAEVTRPANDYVDAILFSPTHGAVVTGTMTDEPPPAPARRQTFSAARDPWFYLHVEAATRRLAPGAAAVEHIPLAEYLFRYDRGGFWVGRWAFRYFFPVPFARLTRWLLDDFLHTRMMYRALHASAHSQRFVVQDLALPFATAEPFIAHCAAEHAIWPLWLCPLKKAAPPTFHPTTAARVAGHAADPLDATHSLNVGLWGPGKASGSRAGFVAANRALEAKVRALGGSKWLYAHTYYGEDEFWATYYAGAKGGYDALRAKYRATTLPSVFDKVKVAEQLIGWKERVKLIWPIGGLWGLWKAIKSRDYLLHRNAEWKYKGEDSLPAPGPDSGRKEKEA